MAVSYTATVGTTDYGFDWLDKEIEIEAAVASVSADDLKIAIGEAQASEQGIVFDQIAFNGNPVTLDPVSGVSTALNVVLLSTWKILTLSVSGTFTLEGGNIVNLVDGVDVFAANNLVTNVNNVSQAGVRLNVGGSALTAAEQVQLANIEVFLRNQQYVNPATNKMEIQNDASSAVVFEADIWDDDGTTAWDGDGPIARRDRFEAP